MRKHLIHLSLILLWSLPSAAAPIANEEQAEVRACMQTASEIVGVPRIALELIYRMEGGRRGQSVMNKNGTVDMGPMQINSWWMRKLSEAGFTQAEIRDDICTNVHVSAWILKQEVKRSSDLAEAIARYHSPTPEHQLRYISRVREFLAVMIDEAERAERTVSAMSQPPLRTVAHVETTPHATP